MEAKIVRRRRKLAQSVAVEGESAIATECAASHGIGRVTRCFPRNEHVEGIHATAQKDADKRAGIEWAALPYDAVGEAQIEQCVQDCRGSYSGAVRLAKKSPARNFAAHKLLLHGSFGTG